MQIKIGKNIENNTRVSVSLKKLINGRTFISAMTDSGKSWTIQKICEEVFGRTSIIIFDPEGEYASLREKFPFLVVGKDIPLEVDSAELLAEQVVKEEISVIFDFSDTDIINQQEFTGRFIDRFMDIQTKTKKSFLVVVEEADELCLTADTEILTKDGWKKYTQIKKGELVLTLNTKKDISEWKPIQKIISKKYEGKMIQIKNRFTDMVITPDHRILCQNSNRNVDNRRKNPFYYYKNYEYREGHNLTSQFRVPCSRGIANESNSIYSEDLIRIISWIITEGSAYSKKKSADKRGYIAITQSNSSNPKNCIEIKKLLDRLGYGYNLQKRVRRTTLPNGKYNVGEEWDFYLNKEASHKLFNVMKNGIHEIPKSFFEMDKKKLRVLFDTLIKGDGNDKKYVTRVSKEKRIQYHATFYCGGNINLANQFQYLTQLLGFRTVLNDKRERDMRITISKNPNTHFKKRNIRNIHYNGIVWDIRNENGNFVVRRNGRPFITGNCPEKGTFKAARSLRSVINIAKKGRKRNTGLILATQRPAFVSKFVISQCHNKIIGRIEWPGDMDVIQKFLRVTNDVIRRIPRLSQGQFFFSGDFVKEDCFVKVGNVITSHTGESPEIFPPSPKALQKITDDLRIRVDTLLEEKLKPDIEKREEMESKMRKVVEKEMEKRFSQKIFGLERQLSIIEKSKTPETLPMRKFQEEVRKMEIPLKQIISIRDKQLKSLKGILVSINEKSENIVKFVISANDKITGFIEDALKEMVTPPKIESFKPEINLPHERPVTIGVQDYGDSLGKCERNIVKFLISNVERGFTKVQLAVITGYSYKSGGFGNALSRLNSIGLITRNDAMIYINEKNIERAQSLVGEHVEELYSKDIWLTKTKLGKCPRRIYKLLLDNPDDSYTKEKIGEILVYSSDSGGFSNAISKLNSLGLIERDDGLIRLSNSVKEL